MEAELFVKPILGLPNTDCDAGVAIAEVNEKVGSDDGTMDDPNATGALLGAAAEAVDPTNENPVEDVPEAGAEDAAKGNPVEDDVGAAAEAADATKENPAERDVEAGTEAVDAGKENPVEGDVVAAREAVDAAKDDPVEEDVELNVEPNMEDFAGCQLEPNKLEVVPPMGLLELASEEGAEAPTPKAVLELKAGVDAANGELPEDKAVLPANPNDGDEVDELN